MNQRRENLLIFAFTFVAFILGTTEYVIVGLLKEVGTALGISLSTAGALVSGFAIAYAIGTPVAVAAFNRFPRKMLIMSGFTVVLISNVLIGLFPSYGYVFTIRIISAVACGFTISLSMSVVSDVVSYARRGTAVAWILGGFSIANVLGVPLGILVGQHVSWSTAFVLTSGLALIPLALMIVAIPRQMVTANGSIQEQIRIFVNRRVWLAFLIPIFGVSSIFVMYTYITPLIEQEMGFPRAWISALLLIYGAITLISNWVGAKVAAGAILSNLKKLFIVQTVMFSALAIALPISWLALLCLYLIACIAFAMNAGVQLFLIDTATTVEPSAQNFAATLMPVAANIGIAVGSALGAIVIDTQGLRGLPWAAAVLAVLAFTMVFICERAVGSQRTEKPEVSTLS